MYLAIFSIFNVSKIVTLQPKLQIHRAKLNKNTTFNVVFMKKRYEQKIISHTPEQKY